jgi:hypothetical protein
MPWRRRESVVILGAGGFGRGILDVIDALNRQHARYEVLGFLDPDEHALPATSRLGGVVIGTDDDLARFDARYVAPARRSLSWCRHRRPNTTRHSYDCDTATTVHRLRVSRRRSSRRSR